MNNEISVIMSVYNEKIEDIDKSIHSILTQTYAFFELIIVNDNPDRTDLKPYLQKKKEEDQRIRVLSNDKNIGLAMSLNRAIKHAKNEILMRMDADDICMERRMEIEKEKMDESDPDVIFSNYFLIDENDKIIGVYEKKFLDIPNSLILSNIVHHPTVMYKKSSVQNAGGYRDFPCSQDYDLWLRMLDKGAIFVQIDKKLLMYRIRKDSISNSKALKQVVTLAYIKKLFFKRKKTGRDDYSVDGYNRYLQKFGDEVNNKQFALKTKGKLEKAALLKKKKNIAGSALIKMGIFLSSRCYRTYFISKIVSKWFSYKYGEEGGDK